MHVRFDLITLFTSNTKGKQTDKQTNKQTNKLPKWLKCCGTERHKSFRRCIILVDYLHTHITRLLWLHNSDYSPNMNQSETRNSLASDYRKKCSELVSSGKVRGSKKHSIIRC